MVSKIVFVVFHILLSLPFQLGPSTAGGWIKASYYWPSYNEFPVSDINSTLFTHLICAYAGINVTSFQLSLSPDQEEYFSTFTETVKQKNPSVVTLLSVGGTEVSDSTFSSMTSDPNYRKSFIDSSIKIARLYGFQGLDLCGSLPDTSSDMFNLGILLEEWRAATQSEARNSGQSRLILTVRAQYRPTASDVYYPIKAMQQYLDWVHVQATDVTSPQSANFTGATYPLYDPSTLDNIDHDITAWIDAGLSPDKLVLNLRFVGYAWTLANSKENGLGAPSTGPALRDDGCLTYREIKNRIRQYDPNVQIMYNETYVVNYCTIGSISIIFDDVEAVKTKVSYAKEKKLLGYHLWQAYYDDNWELCRAAAEVGTQNSPAVPDHNKTGQPVHDHNKNGQGAQDNNKNGQSKRSLLGIVLSTTAVVVLLVGIIFVLCYCWRRNLKSRGIDLAKQSNDGVNRGAAGDFNINDPNLIEYTLADIEEATDRFSIENKLGQGGYGPVYKGTLPDGRMIAVKKLAKTSS